MLEFQYFDGCPNSAETLNNIHELIAEGIILEKDVLIVKIPNMDSAEEYNFQGSPSILIDGIDIYTGQKPTGFNYSCRVYEFNNNKTGVIPKNFIKRKIERFSISN